MALYDPMIRYEAPRDSPRTSSKRVEVEKGRSELMVLQFCSRDSSSLSHVGQYCKERRWMISDGTASTPFELAVRAERKVISSPEVGISYDGLRICPTTGSSPKARLREDFFWELPLQNGFPGLQVPGRFQIFPDHPAIGRWLPATLSELRPDGCVSAFALMSTASGHIREVFFPSLRLEQIREAESHAPLLEAAEDVFGPVARSLTVEVPKDNPLAAKLTVHGLNGGEALSLFLGRPTPAPPKESEGRAPGPEAQQMSRARVSLRVSQDRNHVTSDVGHNMLEHFLNGQPRAVRHRPGKLLTSWTVQLGPFAQHTIEVEKKTASSKLVVVRVDGDTLVEATGEDLGSREGWFDCAFRFVGEKHLDWEVYELAGQTQQGGAQSSRSVVTQRTKYTHHCTLSFRESVRELNMASLKVDGVSYERMFRQPDYREDTIDCTLATLQKSYGLRAPHKFRDDASSPLGDLCDSVARTVTQSLGWDAKLRATLKSLGTLFSANQLPEFCCEASVFVACTDGVDEVPKQMLD